MYYIGSTLYFALDFIRICFRDGQAMDSCDSSVVKIMLNIIEQCSILPNNASIDLSDVTFRALINGVHQCDHISAMYFDFQGPRVVLQVNIKKYIFTLVIKIYNVDLNL